jgi:predicted enzyme related to lactoylglutathione lyase
VCDATLHPTLVLNFGGREVLTAASWTGAFNMVLGLATVIYKVSDLERYFDQPFYVGFNIAGYELGLQPNPSGDGPGPGGGLAYWRVANIDGAADHFVSAGATVRTPVRDVGDAIKVVTLTDPFGNTIGLIENPHFRLPKP